jgi:non-ribosomal peptide synthetase component F
MISASQPALSMRLRGPLDIPALRTALSELFAQPIEPAIVQCTEGALAGALAAARRQPIDITSEPPLRAWLFVLGPTEYVLLLVLHRIAGRERSTDRLLRELGRAYEEHRAGHARVVGWTDLPERGLHEQFERQVARTPSGVALVFDGTEISYAELNGRANQLARYLAKHGVRLGDLVGIDLERSPMLIAAMLAVLKAGAHYTMVDRTFAAESGATTVITMSSRSAGLPPANIDFVYLDVEGPLIALESEDDLPPQARAGPTARAIRAPYG